MLQKCSVFQVVHLHLKLKKRDFRMEHSEMHFVLLLWTKTLHKPNGWWNSSRRKHPQPLKMIWVCHLRITQKASADECGCKAPNQKKAKNVPPEFGRTFEYIKVFFAMFKEQPVTVEKVCRRWISEICKQQWYVHHLTSWLIWWDLCKSTMPRSF